MNAKEILKNKFWIVEDNRGVKFGTISLTEEQYILSTPKSFCPKLITVERYTTKGPFKTEIEMRQELSLVNR